MKRTISARRAWAALLALAWTAWAPGAEIRRENPGAVEAETVIRGGGGAPTAGVGFGEMNDPTAAVPPAWAVEPWTPIKASQLLPFGANLFQGNFSTTRPGNLDDNYVIVPGDQIAVRGWGMKTFEMLQTVDHLGNIFLPDVGPLAVGGLKHKDLQDAVQKKINTIATAGSVNVYTNLLSPQPMTVYVSGFVKKPGRYAGGVSDSILAFIDRAGGIIGERGSYRSIQVMRNRERIAAVDLYDFIRRGMLPDVQLQEGDVVLVDERGPSVAVLGQLRQQARYEHPPDLGRAADLSSFSGRFSGGDLMAMASPLEGVTHVSVNGVRDGRPFNAYLGRADFAAFMLADNDVVEFFADRQGGDIMVMVAGAVLGDTRYPVKKGTTLCALLAHVAVEPATADTGAIYLRRRSAAAQEKKALDDTLRRLEQTALTASSASPEEAELRLREAELIQEYVRRAQQIQPDGVVTVWDRGNLRDLLLEDGDVVVVPQKSQVVYITGEVMVQKTVSHRPNNTLANYVKAAGGFTRKADRKHVLVVRPNGEIGELPLNAGAIGPGDRLLVPPRFESKNLLLVKDLTQILYQLAIATKVVADL